MLLELCVRPDLFPIVGGMVQVPGVFSRWFLVHLLLIRMSVAYTSSRSLKYVDSMHSAAANWQGSSLALLTLTSLEESESSQREAGDLSVISDICQWLRQQVMVPQPADILFASQVYWYRDLSTFNKAASTAEQSCSPRWMLFWQQLHPSACCAAFQRLLALGGSCSPLCW